MVAAILIAGTVIGLVILLERQAAAEGETILPAPPLPEILPPFFDPYLPAPGYEFDFPPAPPAGAFAEMLSTSSAGLNLIKSFEGLRLTAYRDPGGVLTIGWGHTGDVVAGQVISRAQAEQLLAGDVAGAEATVHALVTVPLTQGQFDALVSFVFNIGAGQFAGSTLLRKLNSGDYAGAAAEFDRWVYDESASSLPLPGLVRRRNAEQALFGAG